MRNLIHIVGPVALLILLPCLSACSSCNAFWDRSPCVAGARQVAPNCCPPTQCPPRQCPPRCAPPVTRCPPVTTCPPVTRDPCTADARRHYAPPPSSGPSVHATPNAATLHTQATRQDLAVLQEVNRIREQRGLRALRYQDQLFLAARDHSDEQRRHGYMGHGSPDPQRRTLAQRMGQAGYGGRVFAEVVAWGYRDHASVVAGWMNSPDHRRILLDAELTEAAFSRVGEYWTGNFGAPRRFRKATPPSNGTYTFRREAAPRYTPSRAPAPAPRTYAAPAPRRSAPAPQPRTVRPAPKPAPSQPLLPIRGFG